MNTDLAHPDMAIAEDRQRQSQPIDPMALKTAMDALAFYADERKFEEYERHVEMAMDDRQEGSLLDSDRGERARQALTLLRSDPPTA